MSCEAAFVSCEAAVVSGEAAVVSDEAAVVSCKAPVVSGNAAVACQQIRVTASIVTGAWHIASVQSPRAGVAIGFTRVAYEVAV